MDVELPNTGVEPVRTLLRQNGVNVYSRQGDFVYDGGGAGAARAGRRGAPGRASKGKELTFTLPEGTTALAFDPARGNMVLQDPWGSERSEGFCAHSSGRTFTTKYPVSPKSDVGIPTCCSY
jgi:hypothetical protein